jgi:hypothetical protein
MINLPSSYKLKMLSYRAKSILRGIVGRRGERKRARIFSIFAVLAIVVLIASLSVYGFNLQGKAEGGTEISGTGNFTNNYNYPYQGISIHTKAETLLTDGVTPRGDATVKKGNGDVVRFTLTVTNSNTTTKSVDVKFTLPTGFIFGALVAPIPPGLPMMMGPTSGVITWTGYQAPAGDSAIIFTTNGPS